jgi:predicted Fe-Mo cluster-binding NifX family protein
MRIALPVWDGRVSPVFDTAGTLLVVDVEGARETMRSGLPLGEAGIPERARRMADLGAAVLICGAISREMMSALASQGIRVLPFIRGNVDEVIGAYLSGALCERSFPPRFCMPGCRRGRGRFGRRGPHFREGERT